MKNFKIYLAYVALLAMVMTSCSKEDNPDSPDGPAGEVSTLSFQVFLEDFEDQRAAQTKEHILEDGVVPSCENDDTEPSFIRAVIAIGDETSNNYIDDGDGTNAEAVDIDIIPVDDNDNDGDTMPNWLTYEESFLELENGEYTIIYFDVRNAAGDILYMAPSSDDTYGPANFENFVDYPLPQSVQLEDGTKTYVDLEVLCYDEVYAEAYGYLFFDFEMLPLQYICIFGNECDVNGRHYPSNFRVKIWEYPSQADLSTLSFDDEDALVNSTNDAEWEGEIVTQADPLCIPLPDREGQRFYGEVWTIDSDGEETLIRRGDFDAEQVDELYDANTDTYNYWHFREGDYCGEDSDPCLLSSFTDSEEEATVTFGTGLNDIVELEGLETDYIDVDTDDDGLYYNDNDQPAVGAPAPFGGYLITNNPKNYYGPFVGPEAGDDGNMIVFDGAPNSNDKVLYTLRTPQLCEGDTYYLKMRVKDISEPDVNNARLHVVYRSGDPESATTAGNFAIDPLDTDDNSVWKTVGFIMTATEDGSMLIRIRDREDDNSGNDFAMDDIILSNDPTILYGVSNINPFN
jgi:hypothetical protein